SSIGGAHGGAPPVEAPHQFAADRLHELLAVYPGGGGQAGRGDQDRQSVGVVLRVAIFGAPEQTGPPAEVVFVAAADEPTRKGVAGKGKTGGVRRDSRHEKVDVIEPRLGKAAADEGEDRWRDQIADAAAHRPSRFHFLGSKERGIPRHGEIALDAGEIIVPVNADHPTAADLIIAAAADGAEPAATPGPDFPPKRTTREVQ